MMLDKLNEMIHLTRALFYTSLLSFIIYSFIECCKQHYFRTVLESKDITLDIT